MSNSNKMSDVIFNYNNLLYTIKKLRSELKVKAGFIILLALSVILVICSPVLVLLKTFIPFKYYVVTGISIACLLSGTVLMLILCAVTRKHFMKPEVIEENKDQLFQRRREIESTLYAFFESPYTFSKMKYSDKEIDEKRKSFKSSVYASEIVEYLISKFEKETDNLSDIINKGLDAAYVTGLITVIIDAVNSFFKVSLIDDPAALSAVQNSELFISFASCIIVVVLYSVAVFLVKQVQTTMVADYKTDVRNFEYTIDILKEIKRGLPTQQTTERNDVGYSNEKSLPEMLICETLSSNDNSEEDNGYEKTIKAKYYVHESNKAKGTIDEVKFRYEKHQTKGEVETDSKKADEGTTSHSVDNEQNGCVIANSGASELTDDEIEKNGSDKNADEPKAIIGSKKDINSTNAIDEKDNESVAGGEETTYKDLGNGQAEVERKPKNQDDTQVDDQDGRNDEDNDDDDDHNDDQSNK